jgi:hypothetical protein
VTGLTPGVTYKFVVQSRNIINFSENSSEIQILAAQTSDAPTDLVNVPSITANDRIGLSWTTPIFEGGSALIDYKLWYDNSSGSTWSVFESTIVANEFTATDLT